MVLVSLRWGTQAGLGSIPASSCLPHASPLSAILGQRQASHQAGQRGALAPQPDGLQRLLRPLPFNTNDPPHSHGRGGAGGWRQRRMKGIHRERKKKTSQELDTRDSATLPFGGPGHHSTQWKWAHQCLGASNWGLVDFLLVILATRRWHSDWFGLSQEPGQLTILSLRGCTLGYHRGHLGTHERPRVPHCKMFNVHEYPKEFP